MSMRFTTEADWDDKGRYKSLVFHFWLTLYPDGDMKLSRGEPSVERTGRKMKMELRVPKAVFQTPELKATVTIADPGDTTYKIDAEAAAEALRASLGVDVDVRVIPPTGVE
jgi:hypothetical protein